MQTVPSEFVCQLRPLMFVAGLGSEQQEAGASNSTVTSATNNASAFQQLTQSLRRVFTARQGYPVYDNLSSKRQADYNVILVEKNVRFPPRKARLQNGQSGAHSPISPFTPTSPLYPDGLIAPIWIRKHRELVPSVFVLVLRLYEFGAATEDGTPDIAELEIGPLEKEKIERLRDNELVNEVMNRKRVCSERGIKLAVVLLASRELLDDPTLDVRLSHIRRLSGLDSRASLFVLSPVPNKEVQNFVSSLQGELLESSFDYYREHGRRLRRKRARPAGSNSSVSINASAPMERNGTGTPHVTLNNAALNVRYEFKAATFAEFRSEIEVSLKHYEDCYAALLDLFVRPASSSNPHPFILARTKRWAEARVLADCIIVKICKMYLYAGNAEFAVQTYREHIRRLSGISAEKWSMDETSFEYWSWECKQHRIFADLLESAISAGFLLPAMPGPSLGPPLQSRASAQHVPAQVLQHPGAYYLKAGLAAENRQRSFRRALQEYERSYSAVMTDPTIEEPPKMSAALAHEKNASHSEQIIELYTKAYDHYKASKGVRMTLQLAYLIARTHHDTQKFHTALRFDQRIAKTYRREQWLNILSSILKRDELALCKQITSPFADEQARSSGRDSSSDGEPVTSQEVINEQLKEGLQVCMESLSLASNHQSELRDYAACVNALTQFHQVMHDLSMSGHANIPVVEISSKDVELPIYVNSVFWTGTNDIGSPSPFQLSFCSKAISDCAFDSVHFVSITIHFSDEREPLRVDHDSALQSETLSFKADQPRAAANIRNILHDGTITANLTSSLVQLISVTKVTVAYTVAAWRVELHLFPSLDHPVWRSESSERTHVSSLASPHFSRSCSFEPRKIRLHLEALPAETVYLNERFAIPLTIKNDDSIDVALFLDALLQPMVHPGMPTSETAGDYIQLEGEEHRLMSISNALLHESLPAGQTITRFLYLNAVTVPGERVLDISVVAKPASSLEQDTPVAVTEVTRQITLHTVHPLFCDAQPTWYRPETSSRSRKSSLFDLGAPDIEETGYRVLLNILIGSMGPTALVVHDMKLVLFESDKEVKLLGDTLEEDSILEDVWMPRDPFSIAYELLVQPYAQAATGSTLEVVWSRCRPTGDAKPLQKTTTHIPLPPLIPPALSKAPQVVAYHPPSAILHKPFKVTYVLEPPLDWSPAPITLTFQMDAGSENFVSSGPRKVQHTLILHDPHVPQHQLAEFTLIPIANTALVDLPRFRCWHILETPMQHSQRLQALEQEYFDPETGQSEVPVEDSQVRMRELKIVESWQAIADPSAESDDTALSGQIPPRICVLPR